ncbi:hypothetical protein SA80RD_73 [Escherichia phage vB_EcoS_SA80RD]|nr:hypothetical protein SA80RD_73 [Escherichia phage vB_EcoS_SA80RD]
MQALIQFWLEYNDLLVVIPVCKIIAANQKLKARYSLA